MVLKDCSRCMPYTKSNQRLGEARVVVAGENVTLFFKQYNLKDARYRGRVDFYDARVGVVTALCELVIHRNPAFPAKQEPWMAECQILDVKRIIQRQQDVRAEVSLLVNFQSSRHGSFSGMIRNLSAGGMYLTTVQPLTKGEILNFNYRFRTLERPYSVSVLRGRRLENGSYGYGCRFRGMSDGAEAAVRNFVYRKLEEKQKNQKML